MRAKFLEIYLIVHWLDGYLSAIIDKNNAPDTILSPSPWRELPLPILGLLVAASHSPFEFANNHPNEILEM